MTLQTLHCMNVAAAGLWSFRTGLVLTGGFCPAENVGRLVTPAKKLEDNIRLAELVIEVLQQNEEHHAEVRVPTAQSAHANTRTHCVYGEWPVYSHGW